MSERLGHRMLVGAALALFVGGLWLAVSTGLGDDEGGTAASPTTTVRAPRPKPRVTPPRPSPARFVKLTAAGAFDPEGDGRERDEEAGLAVDGRRETSWRTERYRSFFKEGVGLVLDAGRPVRVEQVVVETPNPGYRAEIRLGARRGGPFVVASRARTLTARTRFPVARRSGRYVVVWVVELPPDAAGVVSAVRVRALK
jgi:eukaryotic-like serine/threonine-protein kinase